MTRQRGVGLIEVIIALIILSIGFLTAASMQVQGMRNNQAAYHRSQALMLLGDMMDRMRNNPVAVAAGDYDDKSTGEPDEVTCLTTGCTTTQVANKDLYDWSARLRPLRGETGFIPALPPAPDGTYATGTISEPSGGVYTLTLSWKEVASDGTRDESLSVKFVP